MLRVRVRLDRLRDAQAEGLVDHSPARHVVPVDERDRCALLAGAARAAGAVQVDLVVLGALVVDDVRDVLDVDAARGDVGRDQHVDLAVAERAQRLLTGALAEVAMDRAGREAAGDQLVGDLRAGALGAREHDRQAATAGLQDAREHLDLVHRVGAVDDLLGVLDGRAHVVGVVGPDVGGLRHVPACHRDDGARHGRGEQHGVARDGRARQELFDVGQEAQVEHLVGLVEHDALDPGQVEEALVHQVDHATGGADDDVDAGGERVDLRLVGAATVDGEHADGALRRRGREVARDLDRELTRREHHERLWLPRGGKILVADLAGGDHAVQQRDAEAEGLAGSGLRLADDVVAGQRDREGHRLDRERVGDPLVGERRDDLGADVVVRKGCVGGLHAAGRGALRLDVGRGHVGASRGRQRCRPRAASG